MMIREKIAWIGCISGIVVALFTLSSHFSRSPEIVIRPSSVFDAGVDFGLALGNAQEHQQTGDVGKALKSASTAAQYSQAFSAKAIAEINAASGTPTAMEVGNLVQSAETDLGRLGETRSKLK
jgi:hypothetical protein